MKLRRRCNFWELKYKLAICAFHSQTHSIAEEALTSFAAEEPINDNQRLTHFQVRLLLAKVYAR